MLLQLVSNRSVVYIHALFLHFFLVCLRDKFLFLIFLHPFGLVFLHFFIFVCYENFVVFIKSYLLYFIKGVGMKAEVEQPIT